MGTRHKRIRATRARGNEFGAKLGSQARGNRLPSGASHGNGAVNYVADRRRPVATVHLATDRLTIPWHPLLDPHSSLALLIPWLAMAAVLLFAALPDLQLTGGSAVHWFELRALSFAIPIDLVVRVAIPLIQLLAALALIRGTLRCLGFEGSSAHLGLAIVPLLPLAMATFVPLRLDGAGWQAVCALALARLLVDRRGLAVKSFLAGGAGAAVVALDIGGMWLVAAALVFIATDYLRSGRAQYLTLFLAGLMMFGGLFVPLANGWQDWAWAEAGALGWAHVASWGLAALVAACMCRFARPPALLFRLGALSAIGAALVALPLTLSGLSAFGLPLGADPLFAPYLAGRAAHAPGQWHDAIGMVAATFVLWVAAITLRRREIARSANQRGWSAVIILSGAMAVLALYSLQAALLAQLLAVPLFALLIRDALRIASRFASAPVRVAAICFALFALTPTGGSFAGTVALSVAQGRALGWPTPLEHAAEGIATVVVPG